MQFSRTCLTECNDKIRILFMPALFKFITEKQGFKMKNCKKKISETEISWRLRQTIKKKVLKKVLCEKYN